MKKFDFDIILKNLQKSDLPELIADEVQKQFKKNFDDEGFFGNPWKEVERRDPSTYAYKYGTTASQTNPILTKSTALRKSIKVIKATWNEIVLGTVGDSVNKYADVHNEGTDNIPQRQFIGDSAKLDKAISDIIEDELDKIFKL